MNHELKNACIEINGYYRCHLIKPETSFITKLKSAVLQVGYIPSDIAGVFKNDPALKGGITGFLELMTYPGIWAIINHRVSHLLFELGIPLVPRLISQLSRFLTGIEIHPGAKIGKSFFIDHGNGVVIGETAEIGDNVTLYHQVTLGGKGGESGKRHPTLGSNIMVGAGAKLLGNIMIGDNVKIGAGSVIVKDIPGDLVVAGNPGRVIKKSNSKSGASLTLYK